MKYCIIYFLRKVIYGLRVDEFRWGANDYARSWYSCDEVEGDFELRYFNINRDKQTIIPFIRAAQKYNPNLTF